jgi:hypothetical protein
MTIIAQRHHALPEGILWMLLGLGAVAFVLV